MAGNINIISNNNIANNNKGFNKEFFKGNIYFKNFIK